MMRRRSIALALLLCAVTGCTSSRVQSVYALSEALDAPLDTRTAVGRSELQLHRVLIPDYLDTTSILLRDGTHELHESSSGRWGERLSLGITRAVQADLADQLPFNVITLARPAENSKRQILIDVAAFDVWRDGHCVLVANWKILDVNRTVVLAASRGTFITPPARAANPTDTAVVLGMADAVKQLAQSIASAAKTLPPQGNARDTISMK
jgi:uncharacterized lipoprotein YmbA